jgi:PncC family amidohydrolase
MIQEKPEVIIGELLRSRGWRLAVAESCTGGLIGHRITDIPGSSTYYMGSVIAYAYDAKVRLLGVKWDTLNEHGAVSEAVIAEMASGVRSGIAGPTGGTDDKPVGLTWIGLSTPYFDQAVQFVLDGNRLENKASAAGAALQLLIDFLEKDNDGSDRS